MANEEQREDNQEVSGDVLTITENLKLCRDVSSMYCKQKFSDVTFILDGQKIHAHKVILAARSKYFDSLFCKDRQESEITLTDVSSTAFRKVLKYIYTGSITVTLSDVDTLDVLKLANKYFLRILESVLAKKFSSIINMKNVCLFFNQANSYEMNELQDACLSFMDKNASEILENDCLNNLTQQSMIKLLERDTFIALEIDIFKSVAKWCKVNEDIDNLVVKCVRLSSLSEEEILLIVRPSKLVADTTLLSVLTEIAEGKRRTLQRGLLLKDDNLATHAHKAQVISGTNTSFLLNDRIGTEEDLEKCTSHSIGDKSGITVGLGVLSYINHISMRMWDEDKRCYSYYIELSVDGTKWHKLIDYSLFRCRSYQNLYFNQKIITKYIRIVGTYSTTNDDFVLVSFATYLKTVVPNIINGIVCPTENVAVEDKGAVLVEGPYGIGSSLKHLYNEIGKNSIIVQLAQPYLISHMKLELVYPEDTYRYLIETSINKLDWEIGVDRRNEDCRFLQTLHFKARPAVYIKITGTKGPYPFFNFKDLECYYSDPI